MLSLVLSTALVAAVYSAGPDVAPDVKDAPAAAHYGGAPSYNSPPQYSPPQYPVFNFPNFDVNYCSVHASFPLIGLDRRHHRGGNRNKRQAYGVPAQDSTNNGYQQPSFDAPIYAPTYFQRPRHFDRQGCRNTAIHSHDSCDRCCQISSRAAGITTGAVGVLMAFDPKTIDERKHDKNEKLNDADRALQCVCCTSRRV